MTAALRVAPTLMLVCLAGCGYSSNTAFRGGVRTVHVETFETREFRRDIEFALTKALKQQINAQTPYRLAEKDLADSVLSGRILEVRQEAFAPEPLSRQPRETQLTLAVQVRWRDLRTGELLIDRPVQLEVVDYIAATGEDEPYALQKVVVRLAERIVAAMYDQW